MSEEIKNRKMNVTRLTEEELEQVSGGGGAIYNTTLDPDGTGVEANFSATVDEMSSPEVTVKR